MSGNSPNLDGIDARGGFSYRRYSFSNGWVGAGSTGLSMNGYNQAGAFGSSVYSEGVQFGYNFQNLPFTVYAGFDTLKFKDGIGGPFDTVSGTLPGYSAHAGVEFQAAPNVSLSVGFGYTQHSGRIDSNINSPSLPGAYPFGVGGPR